ncbi:ferritin-like domain-containing protein [Thiocapsa sp.]|uniref:ferritin-like domain-containing protein n=1 Tax=Thiocapsa sp. TaxID=2024551 RepID=UPI002BEAC40F|nr:ferritin-like domain-containing protein [Thiocapsa sp.]HSO81716.1 ferritin-like domain-containing protein [Thiocapsa sp.]
MTQVQGNLFDAAAACLGEPDPARKQAATQAAAAQWRAGCLHADAASAGPVRDLPGRPVRPELVPPRALKARKLKSREGRAAMIHAVAHIEFNAINLAWDAVQRFREMPTDYYADWIQVAAEEAEHFGLMRNRLRDLGYDYGDFRAHDGLWEMARATAHDPLVRMALVPRVLEARGLDVTPGMIARFEAAGDPETAACLGVILREEVGHVAVGSRWFKRLCEERGLDPGPLYFDLLREYMRAEIRCPLNLPARREAGFDEIELDRLQALCRAGEAGRAG